jgi:hypothetical protein
MVARRGRPEDHRAALTDADRNPSGNQATHAFFNVCLGLLANKMVARSVLPKLPKLPFFFP